MSVFENHTKTPLLTRKTLAVEQKWAKMQTKVGKNANKSGQKCKQKWAKMQTKCKQNANKMRPPLAPLAPNSQKVSV
jgi:hypothetical protein